MSMVRLYINGREIITNLNKTVLQAALENGIEIPHLCYDERIKPYGACGLCVVEVEGNNKLLRACALMAEEGMVVETDTIRTKAARRTALGLLASDHRGDCRPPCLIACPAHTDCQGYVGLVANGEYMEALKLVKDKIPLPSSIGRICPHPCESACRRQLVEEPIAIADIKRFLGDMDIENGGYTPECEPSTGKRVGVIGSGPAGISCAYFLTMKGHSVDVYEAMPQAGGMLRYGIPEYRLPKSILDAEINMIKKMGVSFKTGIRLGEDISLEYLKRKYDSIFLALGAWKSQSLRCKGEELSGVIGGIEFLRNAALNMPINLGDDVCIIGGGNTAMDAARTSVRLGAKRVLVLYRRTRDEMPAEDIEIEEAMEEGVEFRYLVSPIEIIEEGGRVKGVRCQKMRLTEPDSTGRRRPEPILGEEEVYNADIVISAIGQAVNLEDIKELGITGKGAIDIDEMTFQTRIEGVFAGGEVVTGPKIAIDAIAQGKAAADSIDGYLNGEILPYREERYITIEDITAEDFKNRERVKRVKPFVVSPKERSISFKPINETLSIEAAFKEANRCLECGCKDYFECQLIKYMHQYDVDPESIKADKRNRLTKDTHPFISRNPDKCVLCGLCIRACDEIMGITALGIEARGFDSKVTPEFDKKLEETSCISCGQCADVCPTGACIEKQAVKKPVPLNLKRTVSICNGCSTGCSLIFESRGNTIFRAVPFKGKEEGLLCSRGKFSYGYINDENRLNHGIIKRDSTLVKAEYEDTIPLLIKRLQLIRAKYGKNSIGILASPTFTNEEAFILKRIAKALDTDFIGSLSFDDSSVLKEVLGYDASFNSFDEFYGTDLILSFGQAFEDNPILGVKMKAAKEMGVKLLSISNEKTRLNELADKSYIVENNTDFLLGVIKSLYNMGYVKEEFKLEDFNAPQSPETEEIARMYGEAERALLVIDEHTITSDALRLIAYMALLTGKIGRPYRGIILLRKKNNTQGFIDMGINALGEEILNRVDSGKIKGLLIVGEDPVGADKEASQILKKVDFLGTLDIYMTRTAEISDAVIPISTYASSEGTFTRGDRRIQRVNSAIESKSNLDILLEMASCLGVKFNGIKDIHEAISGEIFGYGGISNSDETAFWPNTRDNPKGRQILTPLNPIKNIYSFKKAYMFKAKEIYDTIDRYFIQKG